MPLIPDGVNLFVIDIEYVVDLSKVDPLIPDHIAFLDKYYENGTFLASGAKVPRSGGVIWAVSASSQEVETLVTEDPFHREGIAKYTITEFRPVRTAPGFA